MEKEGSGDDERGWGEMGCSAHHALLSLLPLRLRLQGMEVGVWGKKRREEKERKRKEKGEN